MPCVDPCQRLFCGCIKLAHNSVNMGKFTYSLAILQVDEFCKGAPASHLNHPEEGIHLVWSWEWMSLLSNTSKTISNTNASDEEEEEPANVVCDHEQYILCYSNALEQLETESSNQH